jgi:P27 family predicted phage terminase small subunit
MPKNTDTPKIPAWLNPAGREHWKSTLASLGAVPLRPADADLLGMVCESKARYLAARDLAALHPALDLTPSGLRQHAAHRALADAVSELSRLLTAAGMSPSARRGLTEPKKTQATPAALLAGYEGTFATD